MAVKFDQHTDIDAPIDKVWAIISNSATWPLWFPDVEEAINVDEVDSGTTFQWRGGGKVGSGSIVSVDTASSRLKVVTQMGDNQVTHTFDVDRSGGFLGLGGNDARLRYLIEYDPSSCFLGDFIADGNPKNLLKLKHTLKKIKGLAEEGG